MPPHRDWTTRYAASHQHPVNRVCHLIGIPIILVSLGLLVAGRWRAGCAAWVIGWTFQFAGHLVERTPPEFFRDWRFLFVGLRWWLHEVRRLVRTGRRS